MSGDDETFMRRAILLSREHMTAGEGGPFGAIVVRAGRIIAEGTNAVTSSNDPTAHAEVSAIRRACAAVGSFKLDGCTIYTSCEPCPMCLGAIYWARISRIVYANDRAAAAAIGFDDAFLYDELSLAPARRSIPTEQMLAGEARAVFAEWVAKPDKILY